MTAPEKTLTATTYNLHRCIGADNLHSPERVAQVLNEISPDFAALQEVDTHLRAKDGLHQLDFLVQETGLTAVPGPTIQTDKGDYGNALLCRAIPFSVNLIDLSEDSKEPRGAIDARFHLDDLCVRVICVHLGLRHGERIRQTERLFHELGPLEGPTLIMGDFNDWFPFSRVTRIVEKRLGHAPRIRAFPVWLPFLAIDRIYVHPWQDLKRIKRHASPTARRASDHLPITAEISWSMSP